LAVSSQTLALNPYTGCAIVMRMIFTGRASSTDDDSTI